MAAGEPKYAGEELCVEGELARDLKAAEEVAAQVARWVLSEEICVSVNYGWGV